MNKIIILGSSGHAKVIIELFRANNIDVFCCVGDKNSLDFCLDVPVRKGDEHLLELKREGYRYLFPALGSNSLREILSKKAISLGFELVNAISPAATISPSAKLGKGIAVMAGAVINADSVINDLVIINTGAVIDHDCVIHYAVHIAPQTVLAGNVRVGCRSFLGIGTKVIPQIVIGDDVITGAGSVVVSDVATGAKIAGVPAKTIK